MDGSLTQPLLEQRPHHRNPPLSLSVKTEPLPLSSINVRR